MEKMPIKINSIRCTTNCLEDARHRKFGYTINEQGESEDIIVILPRFVRKKPSQQVIDDSHEFMNGFKVVKTKNGECAYIREKDNKMLPYRYDVASDFNEHGFAMVAKSGMVTWINKDFQYLSAIGNMVDEIDISERSSRMNGWEAVFQFSKGDIPLSRIHSRSYCNRVSYFGIDGEIKTFQPYDGKEKVSTKSYKFWNAVDFDEDGYAISQYNILSAKGYCCTSQDFLELLREKGVLDEIFDDASKFYKEDAPKTYIKK